MPRGDPQTRYPFPPDGTRPFPVVAPLDAWLADLSGWWLEVRCSCRGGGVTYLPLKLLAATHGWDVPLGSLSKRLKCRHCGGPPKLIDLVDNAAGDRSGKAGAPRRQLSLVGAAP